MTSPKRFKDVAEGELGIALLHAARQEQHDERALQRTLLALTAAASATTLGGAGIAKAASASVSGAVKVAQLAAAPGASVAVTGVAKSAALLTVAKWFAVTAIAGGAVLGSTRWWEGAHPTVTPARAVQPSATQAGAMQVNDGALLAKRAAALPLDSAQTSELVQATESVLAAEAATGLAPLTARAAPLPATVNDAPRTATQAPSSAAFGPSVAAVPAVALEQPRAEQAVPAANVPVAAASNEQVLTPTSLAPSSVSLTPTAPGVAPRERARARTSSLAIEVRSLDAARARLGAGDASGALRLLVQHRQRFGTGSFGPEALFLQMQAERALGDGTAARRTARQILEQFPSGPSTGGLGRFIDQF
jgi:hypothetical protein